MAWRRTFAAAFLASCAAAPSDPPTLIAPEPPAGATTGTQLAAALAGLDLEDRERALWDEAVSGNLPAFLRTLVPVEVHAEIGGVERTGTFWCAPDYLGFGPADDWFRAPMTPSLAQRIADHYGATLPTRRMVDVIWRAATVRLEPSPISPDEHDITSVEIFRRHHLRIEEQRGAVPPGALVAGIKKDVVTSALVVDSPGRVCIYGWHRPDGTRIQPLYRGHVEHYVDYSHGIRLVAHSMLVDGEPMTVEAVLADPALHVLLSDEGPIVASRYSAGPRSTPRGE
ncbi:MAG: hypothetical protein AAF957_07625 [Planctomycetota bacterium]